MAATLNPGVYKARSKAQSVYENKGGSLVACFACEVSEGPAQGVTVKGYQTLVDKDGVVNTKTIDRLREIFGWNGLDPFWLMDNDLTAIEFKITTINDTDEKGETWTNIKYMNSLSDSGPGEMPAPAERRTVLTKYGSKFRALSGGAPVTKPAATAAAPKAPAAPSPKVAPPTPAPQTGPKSSMEECWQDLCAAHKGKSQPEIEQIWFGTIERLFPGKANDALTPFDWGKLKGEFDQVPM